MARTRTTKTLAQRIDLNYFRRRTAFKRSRFWVSVAIPALAVLWIAWHGIARDARVYSSGGMSRAHAVLGKECAACHLRQAGSFAAKVEDQACLDCHDGPVHHANQTFTPGCAACHSEHRGPINLHAASNQGCAQCHADLRAKDGAAHFVARIRTLQDGHPEFAALRGGARDPGAIALNHAMHMKQLRRDPSGTMVQLACGDCHRPAAVKAEWTYGDAGYAAARPSYLADQAALPAAAMTLPARRPPTGREFMVPPGYATTCAGCHTLHFDKRFSDGVPHDKPEIVHAFVVKKFTEYIAAHSAELRIATEAGPTVDGLAPASARVATPAQWIQEKTDEAEKLLWRKTCKQCHTLALPRGASLPEVAPAKITARWMPHARFDHDAHRGFSCEGCHARALKSTETSDILLPGAGTCKTCHAPGANHAESRCFECHTYHDWSRRKEVKPKFTLPALRAAGR